MVMQGKPFIQPGEVCDICGETFYKGDEAIVLLNVPYLVFDTVCLTDWQIILRSSRLWLEEHELTALNLPETRPSSAEDVLRFEHDH